MQDEFSLDLLNWYEKEHRELPWRETKDPYRIWLSEVIMQQTRVEQGLSYYNKFLKLFPTIEDLAKANVQEVLKAWQGLGYYSRGRSLHSTSQVIVNEMNSKFPKKYSDLIKLKGIGPYTAAAISSICFNESNAVVDGNVERFLSRYFGIHESINEAKGKKVIQALANDHLNKQDPGDHNQAMMEMGAMICTPRSPKCDECIFSEKCFANRNGLTDILPIKKKKAKAVERSIHYLVCQNKGEILFRKREKKDIWKGLFDFPECDSNNEDYDEYLGISNYEMVGEPVIIKHVLSHQRLTLSFQLSNVENRNKVLLKGKWSRKDDLKKLPIPRSIEKYLFDHLTDFVD